MASPMLRVPIGVVAVLSAAAQADVAEWFWMVSDTGNGDGIIEPGEAALLLLLNRFEPDAIGLAEAGPYTIRGDGAWAAGTVEDYQNLLNLLGFGHGFLDTTTKTISGVHQFQFPPFLNADFDASNPVPAYALRWRPHRYYIHTVSIENGAPDAWFYTDVWGNKTLYEGAGGLGSFTVVPAPAGAAVGLALAACSLRRRR